MISIATLLRRPVSLFGADLLVEGVLRGSQVVGDEPLGETVRDDVRDLLANELLRDSRTAHRTFSRTILPCVLTTTIASGAVRGGRDTGLHSRDSVRPPCGRRYCDRRRDEDALSTVERLR